MKKNIFIVILTVLVIGLSCYIGYEKLIYKEEKVSTEKENYSKEETKKEEDWKDIDLNDKRIESIYNRIKEFSYLASRGAGIDDFNNSELMILGIVNGDFTKEDFTNQKQDQIGNITGTLKLDGFNKGIKRVFNKTKDIDFSKIKSYNGYLSQVKYNYDIKNSSYSNVISSCGFTVNQYNKDSNTIDIAITDGCGGTTGPGPKIEKLKRVSAKESNDTIIIKEKAIYLKSYGDYNTTFYYEVYGDPFYNQYLEQLPFNLNNVEDKTISVENYLDKAATITYTFEKDNKTNEYYFVNSVID